MRQINGGPAAGEPGALIGTANHDLLIGSDGDDVIMGWTGDDVLYGQAGRDVLTGGPGHDVLDAGEGDDRLAGGPGNDRLSGGPGDDDLIGGDGDDVLTGGPGFDAMRGDAGADTYVWTRPQAPVDTDYIEDFALQEDRLDVRGFFVGLDVEWIRRSGISLTVDAEGSTRLLLQRDGVQQGGASRFEQSITLGSLDVTQGGATPQQQALEWMLTAGVVLLA